MNPVVHFEIPAEDRNRMVEFYTRVFGWQAQMLGPEELWAKVGDGMKG